MAAERDELVRGWLRKAESDLLNARIILSSEAGNLPFDTVCFHCQQAAEKSLKAYLISLDISFPKTHNIGQLVELGLALEIGQFVTKKLDRDGRKA